MVAISTVLQRGVLTPIPGSSINVRINTKEGRAKRKREQHDLGDTAEGSFVVHAQQTHTLGTAQAMSPVLILPRSRFPLSYLDPVAPGLSSLYPGLFSASIPALETPGMSQQGTNVLIAKLETERHLYVVERVGLETYAICKLGSWVTIKQLRATALILKGELLPPKQHCSSPDANDPWWVAAAWDTEIEGIHGAKRRHITNPSTILFTMKQPNCRSMQQSPQKARSSVSLSNPEIAPKTGVDQTFDVATEPPVDVPTAQRTLEAIRTHYLEALHLSKTSLAYFAKGPLSRARAAYSHPTNIAMDQTQLTCFLRSSILTLPMMDKKYRETVPQLIRAIAAENVSDHEEQHRTQVQSRKKHKSRKTKPGKDGLYPQEEDFILRGWRASRQDTYKVLPGQASDDDTRISRLRVRETELQIILILEILALETAAHTSKSQTSVTLTTTTPYTASEQPTTVKFKPKKTQDIVLLLDLLLDRLCIWQSVSTEEHGPASPKTTQNRINSCGLDSCFPPKKVAKSGLREFCTEVIVPFYASRLPNQCVMITRKLGGGSGPSPARPALQKSLSASMKPSSARNNSCQKVSNRRLTSDLKGAEGMQAPSAAPRLPPLLVRSATAPAVRSLNWENSEDISPATHMEDAQARLGSRGGALRAKRFTQREIDLSAVSNATEAKIKKLKEQKASVEQELKGAITALKRPDRGLAGREFVESVEKRAFAKRTRARKAKSTPVRNPFAPGIQVVATPRGKRKKNVIDAQTVPARETSSSGAVSRFSPPSGSCIPLSVARCPKKDSFPCSDIHPSPTFVSHKGQNLLSVVQETPSRRQSRLHFQVSPGQLAPKDFRISPTSATTHDGSRSSNLSRTSKFALAPERKVTDQAVSPQLKIQETPHKHPRPSVPFNTISVAKAATSEAQNGAASMLAVLAPQPNAEFSAELGTRSIYESLGWNDDDDADDLI